MKKFLMTIVAAFAAVSMNAQVYVGGGLGFATQSYDGESSTKFALVPEVGYTLDENSAIGIAIGYSQSGKDDTKATKMVVNPYYRYNLTKIGNVNLFVDGSFAFATTDDKTNKIGGKSYKINEWGIGVKPGVAVNLNEKLSFVSHLGFLGYESSKADYDGAKATNTFGFDFSSLNLTFGLYYNF
jgi:hypothetical protein